MSTRHIEQFIETVLHELEPLQARRTILEDELDQVVAEAAELESTLRILRNEPPPRSQFRVSERQERKPRSPLTHDEVYEVIRGQLSGEFSIKDVERVADVSIAKARDVVQALIDAGKIATIKEGSRGYGNAGVYAFVISSPPENHEDHEIALPEDQSAWVAERSRGLPDHRTMVNVERGRPVNGTGRNGMVNGLDTDIRALVQPSLDAGWKVSPQGDGHIRFTHPSDGQKWFSVPTSPSDHRTTQNLKTTMRKAGAPLQ